MPDAATIGVMNLTSINLSAGNDIRVGQRVFRTGIHKTPVASAQIEPLGLVDDVVANAKHHGGPDQAVYVYSAEDYAWWSEMLGRPLAAGTFGDNLTLSGFGPGPLRIGDRYRIGPVVLEVAAPRIPCSTLAAHLGDPGFIDRFRAADRPGFYARVITPGLVTVDQAVTLEPTTGDVTVSELFALWYERAPEPSVLMRVLATPIAIRMRERWSALLNDQRG